MVDKRMLGGLVGVLIWGAGLLSVTRVPIRADKVVYSGYHIDKQGGNQIPVFSDGTNRLPFINRDRGFDPEAASRGRVYDVEGYKNFWGKYATSIRESK